MLLTVFITISSIQPVFSQTRMQTPPSSIHKDTLWNKREVLTFKNGRTLTGTALNQSRFDEMMAQLNQLKNDETERSQNLLSERMIAIDLINICLKKNNATLQTSLPDTYVEDQTSGLIFLSFNRSNDYHVNYYSRRSIQQIASSNSINQPYEPQLALKKKKIYNMSVGELLHESGRYQRRAVNSSIAASSLLLAAFLIETLNPSQNIPGVFALGSLGFSISSLFNYHKSGQYLERAGSLTIWKENNN